ncbi:MAG: N-acetyltransferase, partial [Rikenellaceae bacterium]|nr:N-acetyltransferase [Rikenellaceae bacterium]
TPSGDYALTHTGIPANLRGQGIGSELVEAALEYIDGEGMKVIPLCGFVASYIEEHPQWERIVSDQTNG